MTTPEQRAEWRRLVEGATPSPWRAEYGRVRYWDAAGTLTVASTADGERLTPRSDPDAAFIAEARSALPLLLDEVERLRELLRYFVERERSHDCADDQAKWRNRCPVAAARAALATPEPGPVQKETT
jgi:hypothetical protein